MGDAGLDPRAEEFRPCYPTPPQLYFPYPTPPPALFPFPQAYVNNPAYFSNFSPPGLAEGYPKTVHVSGFSPPPPLGSGLSSPSAQVSNFPSPSAHFSGFSSPPAQFTPPPACGSGPTDGYFRDPVHVNGFSPPPAHVSGPTEGYFRDLVTISGFSTTLAHVSGPFPVHVSRPEEGYFRGPDTAHVRSLSSSPVQVSGFPSPPAHVSSSLEAVVTRTIAVGSVPRGVSETEVRRELEAFGDVRAVEMERLRRESIVTVHFYDLRHAIRAAHEIHARGVALARHVVWARFACPNIAGLPDGYNQGTLVVFNLDPGFSNEKLKQLFEPFGDVKELRETPMKRHQRFIEFYDVRDAAKAYSQLNRKEICGNQIVIEFSRPGGYNKHLQKNASKNPPHCANSYNSQFRKLSSHGSPSGSKKRLQKQKSKKEKDNSCGNQKPMNKNKGWSCRGRQPRCLDSRFLINEDGIVDSSVSVLRTTVMIKNIPNKYSQKLLLNMLDNHCIHCNEEIASSGRDEPFSSYDFVYLPIDFLNKCNVGYGFVNMTSPVAALRLYKSFHNQTWEVYNSKKICEITYARLQGVEALKDHFRTSKFPCATEEYLPVVFSPPRDGRQLTAPLPVAARSLSLSLSSKEEDTTTTNSSQQALTDDDGNFNGDGADGDSLGGSSE